MKRIENDILLAYNEKTLFSFLCFHFHRVVQMKKIQFWCFSQMIFIKNRKQKSRNIRYH